jgi:peptide/nickel transport system ATP-binding protein
MSVGSQSTSLASSPVAAVEDLRVGFETQRGTVQALRSVSLEIAPGEIVALVGESGSGKSVLGMSLLGLVGSLRGAQVTGRVQVAGVDMLTNADSTRRLLRRELLGAVFQDPLTSLDPTMKIGRQLTERGVAKDRAIGNLTEAGVPDPRRRFFEFPHQLSGGLRQRASIAMALGTAPRTDGLTAVADARGFPKLIVADEPTTALDVSVQAQIVLLFDRLRREHGCSVLFVTHDLGVAASIADRIAVMYAGRVCELGSASDVLERPMHPYTRALLDARVSVEIARSAPIRGIEGSPPDPTSPPPGCAYAPRCPRAQTDCTTALPELASAQAGPTHRAACIDPLDADHHQQTWSESPGRVVAAKSAPAGEPALELVDVSKTFPVGSGRLRRGGERVHAVSNVSLTVPAGGAVALVGESGCGKTTTLRLACGLMPADSGSVRWSVDAGRPQLIFQDAGSSLTPWLTIGAMLSEQLARQGVERHERWAQALELLAQVGLDERAAGAKPRELSGGQRQRAAIARALASKPQLLICDEPVSALDASLAIRVLDLLAELRAKLGVALLIVTHDLGVARHSAEQVAVMYRGRIVERGSTDEIFDTPAHPYTQGLLAAIPTTEPGRLSPTLAGEPPSPIGEDHGCAFGPRCPYAQSLCAHQLPFLRDLASDHDVACHFAEQVVAGTAAHRTLESDDEAARL